MNYYSQTKMKKETTEEKAVTPVVHPWTPDPAHLPDAVKREMDRAMDKEEFNRRKEVIHLAIIDLHNHGLAEKKTIMLDLVDIGKKEHTFYKIDCPDPCVRLDGSTWPGAYGVIKGQRRTKKQLAEDEEDE